MRIIPTLLLACATMVQASSLLPLSEEQEFQSADAVCHGKVTAVRAVEGSDGQITTRAWIAVAETFRGKLPATICVESPGGSLPGRGIDRGDTVRLQQGEERIFHLTKTGGRLTVLRGSSGAPKVVRQASGELSLDEFLRHRRLRRKASSAGGRDFRAEPVPPVAGGDVGQSNGAGGGTIAGLTVDASGVPARWLAPDRGEPIPVIVDASFAPPGITETIWRNALNRVFAAWTTATGVTFRLEGTAIFGQSPDQFLEEDEKIRIQFHDSFDAVAPGLLGIGGRAWNSVYGQFNTTGGMGGQINGVEFHKVVRGFIVMDNFATALQNPATFEEVLSHEFGHVLGLNHSSESAAESNQTLRDALMYFTAHADGRGASLRAYDTPVAQKAHPLQNTPPWSSDRVMSVITHSVISSVAGFNEIKLPVYSKLPAPPGGFTLIPGAATTLNGSFTPNAGGVPFKVRFTPNSAFSSRTVNPSTGNFLDEFYCRIGNGVNCSPWVRIIVAAFAKDGFPSGASDGVPDSWMFTWFGSSNPATGTKRGASQDFDGDGLTNLEEYLLGTSPVSAASFFQASFVPGQLQWTARPWTTYELEGSDNLQTWRVLRTINPPGVMDQAPNPPVTVSTPFIPGAPGNPRFVRMRQLR